MATVNSTDQRDKTRGGRLNVYSDLPIRGVAMAARTCPLFLEPIILFGFSMVAFALLKSQRRAIRDNIKLLIPEIGCWQVWWEVFAVFHEFSRSISDAAYVRCGRDMLTWEIENPAAFDELTKKHENGAIMLTAHMGNYDLAGSLFSNKFPAPVHSVRAPERDPLAQEAKEKELAEKHSDEYVIHFNKGSEDILGLELAKALSKGDYVAIQGDRIQFDVSGMDAVVPGRGNTIMKIPAGPFVLSQITGAGIFPLFVKRSGHRKYCVVVHDPIHITNERSRRKELQKEGSEKWMDALFTTISENHRQWLMFEPAFFETNNGGESLPPTAKVDVAAERELVRSPPVKAAGFWPSYVGAAVLLLLVCGALLFGGVEIFGIGMLWFLIPALPLLAFLACNFLGAITTGITMLGWSGAKEPWTVGTIVLGTILSALALALIFAGGLFLQIIAIPWLIWVLIRALHVSLQPLRQL